MGEESSKGKQTKEMAQLPEIGACMLLCVAPLAGRGELTHSGAAPRPSVPGATLGAGIY